MAKLLFKPVETDTIVKDNTNDFEKHISYKYNYIDSVIEDNDIFIPKKLNQPYLILIMSIVVLKF